MGDLEDFIEIIDTPCDIKDLQDHERVYNLELQQNPIVSNNPIILLL